MGQILKETPSFICRGGGTLKQKLVKSYIKDPAKSGLNFLENKEGFFGCGCCLNCRENGNKKRYIEKFQGNINEEQFQISGVLTCHTKQVIYKITCPCGYEYIGKTKRNLYVRIREHINNIKKGFEKHSVSLHFKQKHGSDPKGLNFMAIEKVKPHWRGEDMEKKLSKTEMEWIFKLNTMTPNGLNSDFEICHFL